MQGRRTFDQYSAAGASHDVMDALRLLTEAYVTECGVSLGNRTAVFYAAEEWQEKLAWMDMELSGTAREVSVTELMPLLSGSYSPECDDYDISGMDAGELIECCKGIICDREFDEDTLEVLCRGIDEYATKPEFTPFEVTAASTDGRTLKGLCYAQSCGGTTVEMTEPFKGLTASRNGLVREPRTILSDAFMDYVHLQESRDEARELYAEYKEKYMAYKGKSGYRKVKIFNEVYKSLLAGSVLCSPETVLSEIYGLEFYDSFSLKDPSWYMADKGDILAKDRQ